MPLGFVHRPGTDGWAWWATDCASPGAIRGDYDKDYFVAPAGQPQVYAWSLYITPDDHTLPPEIASHEPKLPTGDR